MSRELFQTALEFCHDLLAEWEWKKGERAGLGEEYDELLEFISTLKHEIVKPLPKPVAVIGETYSLLWTGKGHLTHGVKVGVKLYAEPPARNCSEWISVEDKLPKSNKPVLVHYKTLMANSVISVGLNFDGHGIFRQLVGGLEIQEVTHWMPLPERPELKTAHGITDTEQSKPQSNAI
jgi:hypothetical protein